jgi:hypothetical protein
MTDGIEGHETTPRKIFRRCFPLVLVLWILFVLYPNPANLVISIDRVFSLEAKPSAVEFMLNDLPSDPVEIEKAVLAGIPYRHDWEVYGMPWYCPTVEQVLARGEGDCKSRALVLASVLEARGVSYQIHISPIHVWVDCEGKNETPIENVEVGYYGYDPETGERQFKLPHIGLSQVMNSFWRAFWGPMPNARKALLISGLVGLITARVLLRQKKKTAQETSS